MNFFLKRPFFFLGVASIGCILLVDWFHISVIPWIIINVLLLITGMQFEKQIRKNGDYETSTTLLLFTFLAIFLVGLRFITSQPLMDPGNIAWYNDSNKRVTIIGTIKSSPDERDDYTNLRVKVSSIISNGTETKVEGIILVRVPPNIKYNVGDGLKFQGTLRTPPDDIGFNYKDYLARQGIHSLVTAYNIVKLPFQGTFSLLRSSSMIREKFLSTIRALFPEPEGSLLAGILLGADKGMTSSLQEAFRNTGTTHIIAISGFNITILVAMFMTIFKRLLGRWKGAAASIMALTFYTLLVGAEASVIRAAIMGGTAIIASQVGRKQDGLNILGFAVFLMCIINPNIPWDVGFQLSFAATLGLILYAEPMQGMVMGWLSRKLPQDKAQKWASPLAEYLLFTLAAQLTTLPIIAYHFGQISLTSFLVNPLILPAQPPVMVASGLAVLVGAVYLPLGKILAWLAWPFSMYTIRMVELFERIPHGIYYLGEFSFLFVVSYYLLLLGITYAPAALKEKMKSQLKPAALIVFFALITILVWKSVVTLPDNKLHITFLDVDDGSAILVQTPSGKNLLINGGSSRSELADALGRRLSPFNRRLDALIIASTQEIQLTALPGIMEQYPPSLVLWSGQAGLSDSALQLRKTLEASDTMVIQAEIGLVLDLDNGAQMEVMTVTENGMVMFLKWNNFTALLPMEMIFEDLADLMKKPELDHVSLFLLPASGYSALNPEEWIDRLAPDLGILTVSSSDNNRLPDKETINTFEPYPLLRTEYNGWIEVITDGNQMWVVSEH